MNTDKITRKPFPNSAKIFVDGTIHPIQVAMRRIELTDTVVVKDGEKIGRAHV